MNMADKKHQVVCRALLDLNEIFPKGFTIDDLRIWIDDKYEQSILFSIYPSMTNSNKDQIDDIVASNILLERMERNSDGKLQLTAEGIKHMMSVEKKSCSNCCFENEPFAKERQCNVCVFQPFDMRTACERCKYLPITKRVKRTLKWQPLNMKYKYFDGR